MPKIPYPGGKARLAKQIVSFLPREGRTYLEPFCGRANLFWEAVGQGLRFQRWWLNDLQTASFLEAIQTHGHRITIPPRSRQEFEKQREAFKSGDPTAILLAPHLSFSGGLYEAGCKGGTGDGSDDGGVTCVGYKATLRDCHRILKRTAPKITSLDWRELGLENLTEHDCVIFDPPYPNADVKSYSDKTVNYEELVDVLLRARFRWLLCGYAHPLLHRLGSPIWARDVQQLCNRPKSGEDRTECLWANFTPEVLKARRVLPSSVRGQIKRIADATSLSFSALDAKIDNGLNVVAKDFSSLVPYLLEMHRRLSAPGKRTDLRKGAPIGLTWTQWVETKRHKLGRSLRTIQYMLKGQTRASQDRQLLLSQRHASLRSEPDLLIPDTPLEIATEMSRLVLEMRNDKRSSKLQKQRLEILAQHFLQITGGQSSHYQVASPEITDRKDGSVTLRMQ